MDIPGDGSAASLGAAPRSLGFFIVNNLEAILQDWEEYARSVAPAAASNQETLRDHAKRLLRAIAADISRPQSLQTQEDKSKGLAPGNSPGLQSAGEQHALARIAEQFDLEQLIGEFRAVRGSVLRRWATQKMRGAGGPEEMTRFNESIDEALAASARHYAHTHASIINSTSDAIVGKTTEGIITSWNPSAERIFGYTAQEAIGQSAFMLLPAGRADEELDILARIARGEQAHSFDTVRVRKDGTHVHVSVSPISDGHGSIVSASKIARDITERIDADTAVRIGEESFRAMADSIPQMAWTARADGFIFWYNQRWYDFTGTTLEQTEGWNWQSVHDPEVLPRDPSKWNSRCVPPTAISGSFSPAQCLSKTLPAMSCNGRARIPMWMS